VTHLGIARRGLIMAGAGIGLSAGLSGVAQATVGSSVSAPANKPSLTVFNFGAVGDGVTDDSGAFSAALKYAAANGQVIQVPGFTYAIKQPIVWVSTGDVGSPWGFQCQGATLVSSIIGGQDVISLTSVNTVRYFQLTGALKITGTGSDACGLHIAALGGSVYFYNALIGGLSVERVGEHGLFFEGNVFESTVMNSCFEDCGQNGATFAQSKGGICSAIMVIACFFAQNGNYGLCATNLDGQYGGTTDVRVYGGYCRDNQSYGFYYNNGTAGGTTIEQVGFENNCKKMAVGTPNGAHVYGMVGMQMRSCTGYSSYGGATNLLAGWFSALTYLDGCNNSSAATPNTYVVQVSGNAAGHVYMVGCNGGIQAAAGTACTWQAVNCTGSSPKGALSIRGTVTN
jgi:hypothetical protein